ncbi:hypothetical protein L0222_17405 [bacterium]|nr:hypothetical protein [bacterium]MCI0603975.1 hypothetical protein [bacterium]
MSSKVMLSLPAEEEIETTMERMIPESSFLIEKTIRYKSGLLVKLIQDFTGRIFRFSVNCADDALWISNQSLLHSDAMRRRS